MGRYLDTVCEIMDKIYDAIENGSDNDDDE